MSPDGNLPTMQEDSSAPKNRSEERARQRKRRQAAIYRRRRLRFVLGFVGACVLIVVVGVIAVVAVMNHYVWGAPARTVKVKVPRIGVVELSAVSQGYTWLDTQMKALEEYQKKQAEEMNKLNDEIRRLEQELEFLEPMTEDHAAKRSTMIESKMRLQVLIVACRAHDGSAVL